MSLTPAAEITRAETGQRARLLRVRSYDVTLDLTRGAETFGSVSLVRFDCAEPGAASHADLVARAVHEITLNGVPLDPAAVWADGRITLPALAARPTQQQRGRRVHAIAPDVSAETPASNADLIWAISGSSAAPGFSAKTSRGSSWPSRVTRRRDPARPRPVWSSPCRNSWQPA